jgi:hypothetical protein
VTRSIPRISASSTSFTDQNGNLVYLKAKVTDDGEPGTVDIARIFFSYTDPNASHAPFITDIGAVSNGNIQVFLR